MIDKNKLLNKFIPRVCEFCSMTHFTIDVGFSLEDDVYKVACPWRTHLVDYISNAL